MGPRRSSGSGQRNAPGPESAGGVVMSTIGNEVTFRVWTSVSASNSSSSVPKPPGRTMNPCAYLTNIVLRAKK